MTMYQEASRTLGIAANALRCVPAATTVERVDYLVGIVEECERDLLKACEDYLVADYSIEIHPLQGSLRAIQAMRNAVYAFRHPLVVAVEA